MSNQSELQIGKIHTEKLGRDAIHVAIIQVTAMEELDPGQHVGISQESALKPIYATQYPVGKTVGIIDPYIQEVVKKGMKCYLFLYPQTVTSLRHVWEHPTIKPEIM